MQSVLDQIVRSKKLLRVGILGFGVDGQAVAKWLSGMKEVGEVLVFDDGREVKGKRGIEGIKGIKENAEIEKDCEKITFVHSLDRIDLLFRSPGFPQTHPLVLEAKEKGIPITSSTSLVLQEFRGITVGITGSNGKTTCTALIEAMLKQEFGEDHVERGGNDGIPRVDLLDGNASSSHCPCHPERNAVETKEGQCSAQHDKYLVLELSSFQLIDCPVSPDVAVVLNISPNHLDWHVSMEEYAEAKRRIVVGSRTGGHEPRDKRQETRDKNQETRDKNQETRDKNQETRTTRQMPIATGQSPITILNQNDPIVKEFAASTDKEVRWFEDLPDCSVRCKTHPDTIKAAVTAARALGVSEENIITILTTFPGVPHRLEFVREIDGVSFWNDSSATTPESVIVACRQFAPGTMTLLMGGRDKGMSFDRLYEVIQERDVLVVPYGEMIDVFAHHLPNSSFVLPDSPHDFHAIIRTGWNTHRPHIVLSPACASFDMFNDAKERGKKFADIVMRLS